MGFFIVVRVCFFSFWFMLSLIYCSITKGILHADGTYWVQSHFLNYHEISNDAFQIFNLRLKEKTGLLLQSSIFHPTNGLQNYFLFIFHPLPSQRTYFSCHLIHNKLYKKWPCQLFPFQILGWVIIPPSVCKTSTITALKKQPLAKCWGGEK